MASDDPHWARSKFSNNTQQFKIHFSSDYYPHLARIRPRKYAEKRFFDLALLAKCEHTIYAYGTYGFWGEKRMTEK